MGVEQLQDRSNTDDNNGSRRHQITTRRVETLIHQI